MKNEDFEMKEFVKSIKMMFEGDIQGITISEHEGDIIVNVLTSYAYQGRKSEKIMCHLIQDEIIDFYHKIKEVN